MKLTTAWGTVAGQWGIVVDLQTLEKLTKEFQKAGSEKVTYIVRSRDGVAAEYDAISDIESLPNDGDRQIVQIDLQGRGENLFTNGAEVVFWHSYGAPVRVTIRGEPAEVRERLSRVRGILSSSLPWYAPIAKVRRRISFLLSMSPALVLLYLGFRNGESAPSEISSDDQIVAVVILAVLSLAWLMLVDLLLDNLFPPILFAFGRKKNTLHRLTRVHQVIGTSLLIPFLFWLAPKFF